MTKIRLGVRRVAFLGSSTASRSFAPFGNPDWEIWATGPGIHGHQNPELQFDRWFELHDMADNDPVLGNVIDQGYYEWLAEIAHSKAVYYKPPIYKDLKGKPFPWDEIRKKHCGYFLDSTVAWMMAMCLECCDVDEIGLFGIDFATDAERVKQRKGAKHFVELFKQKGVKVTIPEISEMAFDPEPYPHESVMALKYHRHLKLLEPQVIESEVRIKEAEKLIIEQREILERTRGVMETLLYFKENWT